VRHRLPNACHTNCDILFCGALAFCAPLACCISPYPAAKCSFLLSWPSLVPRAGQATTATGTEDNDDSLLHLKNSGLERCLFLIVLLVFLVWSLFLVVFGILGSWYSLGFCLLPLKPFPYSSGSEADPPSNLFRGYFLARTGPLSGQSKLPDMRP
jgi:hypothetical protein